MEAFCRACLNKFNDPTELLQYCESNRRLFVYCTGLQVKRDETFTFQLCKECYINLKLSCKFKKLCRTSDKKFKNYLALKKDGESIEFGSYIQNIEDTLTLRIPITSSNSTPVHKNYNDDDNESTCTSIQNFMSDMLQGEEMLPTEARIIREVIQEEADILEDSLDSHWLQDEVSIDNDIGMDFNFTGFSTPHSIDNDHCYTPRRLTNDKEDDAYYYTPKDTLQLAETQVTHDQRDMPLLEIAENDYIDCTDSPYNLNHLIESDKQATNTSNQNDMPLLDDCDIRIDGIIENYITMEDLESGYRIESTEKHNNDHITVILNKGVASKVTNSPLTDELEYYMNKVELNRINNIKTNDDNKGISRNNEKNIDTVLDKTKLDLVNKSTLLPQDFDQHMSSAKININKDINIDSLVKFEPNQYTSKVELKKKINIALNQNDNNKIYKEKCSIDKNLEIALKNDDSQEFSLDQLLISPQVSIRSGASTPTINNILFGNLTPRNKGTIEPDLGHIAVKTKPNPTDFLEEFLRDDCQQSTPKKATKEVERRVRKGKDMIKLKESKVKTQRKIIKGDRNGGKEFTKSRHQKQNKRNRGYKDIKRLKELVKVENKNNSETSDSETLDTEHLHPTTEPIDNEDFELDDENRYETSDCEMLDDEQSHLTTEPIDNVKEFELGDENCYETSDSNKLDSKDIHQITESFDNKEHIKETPKNIDDDLDISISNLLNFDDNQSVDFNISIASDFLREETQEDNNDNDSKDLEYPFKVPFSPPDNKYDFDKNLCKICDKTYKSRPALKVHFVRIHKQQLPRQKKIRSIRICSKCGKSFRDDPNFHKHMKKHEDPDIFKCKYCTLEFPTRGRFKQHLKCHASEIEEKKDLATDEKDKDESNEQSKKEDIGASKGNKQSKEERQTTKSYVCPTCGKVFQSSGNFHVHLRRHNKTFVAKCMICDKGFTRNYDLNVHMRTHGKEYPFECQHCPKKYRTRHLLIGHMYRHLGKDKFKCEFCNTHFVSIQYLKQHHRTELCANNRKALDKDLNIFDVTVTYQPYVSKQPKTKESPEIMERVESETEESIDTNKTEIQCPELTEDEVTKSDLSSTEKIIATSTLDAN